MIRVILADDHPTITTGVCAYIDGIPGVMVVATASSAAELIMKLENMECDLVVTDFSMPIINGVTDGYTMLAMIRRKYPAIWLLVLTMNEIPAVLYQIIKSGVHGVLHKSDEISEIGNAIRSVSNPIPYLGKTVCDLLKRELKSKSGSQATVPSLREAEVLRLYVAGYSLWEIAAKLNKSIKTVGLQKASAMKKMGFRNDIELGCYARAIGGLNESAWQPTPIHKTVKKKGAKSFSTC